MPWELTGNSITANGGFLGTTDAQPLSIRTKNVERMRLTSDGELLIGTTSPVTGTRLRVAGGGATINNVAIGTDAPPGIDYPEQDRTIGVTGASHTLRLQSPNAVALHTGPSGTTTEENQRLTVNTAGNVGIGTMAPAHKLDVAGTINATSVNAGTIDATDVQKNGSSLVSSQWSNATDGISYGVGNVGIGAVNPSYKLNVDGAMNATSINAGTIDATDVRTNGSSLVSSQWTSATGGGISYAAGNVGIGTINSAYKLNVDGAMNATSINAGTIDATDVRTNGSSLVSSQWSNVASGISYGVGNVGIGKTAEAIYRLDVAGAINATDVRTNGSSLVSSQWTSAPGGISYGGNVAIGTAAATGAKLSVSGGGATINNIAIGTDVAGIPGINYPNEAETIGVATTTATLRLQSPNGLTFHTGATGGTPVDNQRVTITSGGNVGIGTTTPSVKLDVAGPVNATDVRANGSSLVSSQWSSVAGGISYATGNVGVGTTVPDRPLTIQGSELVGFRNAAGATKWHINDRGGSGDLNVGETGVADGRLYLRAGGNVGIGTTTPRTTLEARGHLTLEAGGSPVLFTGTGTSELNRHLALINSPDSTSASGLKAGGVLVSDTYAYANPSKNDLIVKGSVGVGTANPQFGRLMIEDGSVPLSLRETGQAVTQGGLWRMPLDAGILRFDVNTAAAGDFSSYLTPVAMNAAGNVGIGTTAPGARLDISGSGGATQCCAPTDHPPTLSLAEASSSANRQAWLQFHNGGEAEAFIRLAGGGPSGSRREGQRRLEIGDTQSARASLTVQGNVGIGTIDPKTALHLPERGLQIGFSAAPTDNFHFTSDTVGGARGLRLWNGNYGAGGHILTALPNSNVGIGNANPQAKLQVSGGAIMPAVGNSRSAGIQFPLDPGGGGGDEAFIRYFAEAGETTKLLIGCQNDPDDRISFYQFGAERMTVYNGNVGIGTATPKAKLSVNGGATISGDVIVGAGGNATLKTRHIDGKNWQDDSDGGLHLNFSSGQNVYVGNPNAGGTPASLVVSGGLNITQDVAIAGRLGTAGWSPTPRTSGWGGGIHTWDVEAEGTMWSRGGIQSGNRDLAENHLSDTLLESGDVVCLHPVQDRIVLSQQANAASVVGVVSTAPGMVLNADRDIAEEKMFPVALCGRVPCKVVDENGPIARGDLLTSSSTPGYAMKALPISVDEQEFFRPGTIIGKALEPLPSGEGVIDIFVP